MIIPLGGESLRRSSDLPGSLPRRAGTVELALNPSLFGLAPCGVCLAATVANCAVRSYRTFSPLPACGGEVVFCGPFRQLPLTATAQALPGTPLFGVRTFLRPEYQPCLRSSGPIVLIPLYRSAARSLAALLHGAGFFFSGRRESSAVCPAIEVWYLSRAWGRLDQHELAVHALAAAWEFLPFDEDILFIVPPVGVVNSAVNARDFYAIARMICSGEHSRCRPPKIFPAKISNYPLSSFQNQPQTLLSRSCATRKETRRRPRWKSPPAACAWLGSTLPARFLSYRPSQKAGPSPRYPA